MRQNFRDLLHQDRRDFIGSERGTIAILFALLLVPLLLFTGGAIDYARYNAVRADIIESLDAAGLAIAQYDELNPPEIASLTGTARDNALKQYGRTFFFENFRSAQLIEDLAVDFIMNENTITPSAGGTLKTVLLRAAGPLLGAGESSLAYMAVASETEITRRGSGNIELALILDTTGSMAGQKIIDLRNAANDLVNIVVRDEQTPFYSKVAVVPYSLAVNLGGYASAVRGAVPGSKAVTAASWSTGAPKSISGATRANPVRITSSSHGFNNGDVVWISGVSGMTQLNNRAYAVTNRTTNTFDLQGVNGSSYKSYSSGGTIQKCLAAACNLVFTSVDHGFANGDWVVMAGVSGLGVNSVGSSQSAQAINNPANAAWRVGGVTANSFVLDAHTTSSAPGAVGPYYNTYSSGGQAWCTTQGCQYYRFTNANGGVRVHQISTCVSERAGGNAYTDAPPSSTPLGRHYPPTGNPCPTSNPIVPLTDNRTTLQSAINAMAASGSTGGHVGVAWGWYMLSPRFGYLWPAAVNRPADYGATNTQKIAVLMTDGEYNSSYCNGVISGVTSTSGSGSLNDKINCAAPNGHAFDQATRLCEEMRAAGVIVYTVGFQIVDDQRARDLVNNCASGPGRVYLAATGAQLREAFQTIAGEVSQLRVSR